MKNILCLYYTRTETTKIIMEQIAKDLNGELVEFTDGKSRAGAWGYLSACIDSYRKQPPQILPLETERPLNEYSAVIIGGPIWAEKPCCVINGLLRQYKDELPENVYFVVTHSSTNTYEKKINRLDKELNTPHKGFLSVSTKKGAAAELEPFEKEVLHDLMTW